jgi:G3E family GTPase
MLIITGFLGVGKTTFILRIIDRIAGTGVRLAAIVNDFGEVNVDGKVMEKYGLDVQESSGGCICCTLRVSLIETIRTLALNFKPDLIVMEPSGIADPESLKAVVLGEGVHSIRRLMTLHAASETQ